MRILLVIVLLVIFRLFIFDYFFSSRISYEDYRSILCEVECLESYNEYVDSVNADNKRNLLRGVFLTITTVGAYSIISPSITSRSLFFSFKNSR